MKPKAHLHLPGVERVSARGGTDRRGKVCCISRRHAVNRCVSLSICRACVGVCVRAVSRLADALVWWVSWSWLRINDMGT